MNLAINMPKKKRILRILNRFNLGGPVYNASYLTKYLEEDFETMLIGGQKLDEEEDALFIPESLGITAHVIPEMTRSVGFQNDFKAYRRIRKIIEEFKPDIVHTHASKAGALGRYAAYKSGVKHIVHTYHGHVFEHYFGPVKTILVKSTERFLARKSSAIIAISEKQKVDIVDRFQISKEENTHVIPLGFELEKFRLEKERKREVFRNKYGLKDDDLTISIIGRLAPIKNHELFLRVVAKLQSELKNLKVFVVGDGDSKVSLIQKARHHGLTTEGEDQNIFFTSWIKQIHEILPGLELVTLCSLNEGTPVSLIEAQAAGIAVVSSDVGGVRDVVGKDSGLLFTNNDEEDYLAKMRKVLTDSDLRSSLGRNGEKFAFENFTAQRLAGDVKKLYLELLNRD